MMEYFIKLIKKKHKVDVSKDARAVQKLRREAERAKRALSSQHQVRGRSLFCVCVLSCTFRNGVPVWNLVLFSFVLLVPRSLTAR